MTYERFNEEYPDAYEIQPNTGKPREVWGQFGYPDAMLGLAIAKDDPAGFRFYFDRYFSLDGMTIGGSLPLIVANKGAEKCVRELVKMGATDTCLSAKELIARAKSCAKPHQQAA